MLSLTSTLTVHGIVNLTPTGTMIVTGIKMKSILTKIIVMKIMMIDYL